MQLRLGDRLGRVDEQQRADLLVDRLGQVDLAKLVARQRAADAGQALGEGGAAVPADHPDGGRLAHELTDARADLVLETALVLHDGDGLAVAEIVNRDPAVASAHVRVAPVGGRHLYLGDSVGLGLLFLFGLVRIDERHHQIAAGGRLVLGQEVAHLALGSVRRRGKIRGEVSADLHRVFEVLDQALGALAQGEPSRLGPVPAHAHEVDDDVREDERDHDDHEKPDRLDAEPEALACFGRARAPRHAPFRLGAALARARCA